MPAPVQMPEENYPDKQVCNRPGDSGYGSLVNDVVMGVGSVNRFSLGRVQQLSVGSLKISMPNTEQRFVFNQIESLIPDEQSG